jgi:hypothetical protein
MRGIFAGICKVVILRAPLLLTHFFRVLGHRHASGPLSSSRKSAECMLITRHFS